MSTLPHPSGGSAAPRALRTILVVDGDSAHRHAVTVLLKQLGYEPTGVGSFAAALEERAGRSFDAWMVDVSTEDESQDRIEQLCAIEPDTIVIAMAPSRQVDRAVEAMRRGACDRVQRPFLADEITAVLRNANERLELRREIGALRQGVDDRPRAPAAADASLLGASAGMRALVRTLHKIAEHKTTVLITGESGTGKELAARAIHAASPRRDGPFVAVNCGAIPEPLLESELFGHKKGAFTDAVRDKAGLFTQAGGGTLFLDEIGEMPLGPQVRLLRVLQEQRVRPVGGTEDERVDVRVVAATMRDLAADVRDGRFREDLFYRINVIQVALPPLRERREDLPQLIEHFLARTNQRLGTHIKRVAPEAMKLLTTYGWPGNVRELENTIERSVVLCDGDTLVAAGLPEQLSSPRDPIAEVLLSGELSIKKTVRIVERELIRRALGATGGNRTNASKKLEISHRALLYKMKEFGIVSPVAGARAEKRRTKFDDEG